MQVTVVGEKKWAENWKQLCIKRKKKRVKSFAKPFWWKNKKKSKRPSNVCNVCVCLLLKYLILKYFQ